MFECVKAILLICSGILFHKAGPARDKAVWASFVVDIF